MSRTLNPKFLDLVQLSSNQTGAEILFATDDWFAEAENLLSEHEPVFKHDLFTDCGKWMDGWETRRKRIAGHDWCIIKLGLPGVIHGVDVDTCFFTGNYAPRFSLQAANLDQIDLPKRISAIGQACTHEDQETFEQLSALWTEVIPMTELRAGVEETRHNYFEIKNSNKFTHVRLNIYPDGGIARLRVFGSVQIDWNRFNDRVIDLLSIVNGARILSVTNAHYGHPRNLTKPGVGVNMGDGWETARRLDRPPILQVDENGILNNVHGNESCVAQLGHEGIVERIDVETTHFKGNCPDSITVDGCLKAPDEDGFNWSVLLKPSKLRPHDSHSFVVDYPRPISHVRITIAPDGGISRVRVFGAPWNISG